MSWIMHLSLMEYDYPRPRNSDTKIKTWKVGFGVICLIMELVGKYVLMRGFVFYKVFLVLLILLLYQMFVKFACKIFCKFFSLCEKQFHKFTFVVVLLIFLYFIISYPSRYLNFMSIRYLYLLINSCTTITHIVLMICKFLVRPWRKAERGRGSAYEVNSYWWCFQYGWKSCTS